MDKVGPALVLRHKSALGDFVLSSDTLANSNRGLRRAYYEAMGDAANENWHRDGGSIGGRLVFPSNRIDGKQTINQRRGTHARIRDRFDLTLEAIRRHYSGETHPLDETFGRYTEFFRLFEDFAGYVDFFHLQDLVSDDRSSINFYIPFDDFQGSPLPTSTEAYREFRAKQLAFVAARNERLLRAWTS